MKAKTTSKSLKDENLFLFHGDEFLIKQKVSNLIEHLLEPEFRTTNLQVLDGSNFELSLNDVKWRIENFNESNE
jgi:hypothetical protein